MNANQSPAGDLVRDLRARLPDIAIATDDLGLYQTDIYYVSEFAPLAVATPRHVDDVIALVRLARELKLSLATRGAGLSYSAGYIPSNARTVIVDMSAMNRIVEINAIDRYVTVEAGVTWATLRDALQPLGLTTPFWGTFSGRHATIGASLSQGAKFYGSASRGMSAESALALKVVTGEAKLLTTGSAATPVAPSPFFRNYGPDLTGAFLGDCGAFGIKTEATLMLVPAAGATAFCSFSFEDPVAQMRAMSEVGAEMLAAECLGIDPFTARARMESEGLGSDLRMLMEIARGGTSLAAGLGNAVQIAASGRRFAPYRLPDELPGGGSRPQRRTISRGARSPDAVSHGGRAVPAAIPRVMRSIPFPSMSGLLTPSGKRMNWLHTVVPNSVGGECFTATEAVFRRNEA